MDYEASTAIFPNPGRGFFYYLPESFASDIVAIQASDLTAAEAAGYTVLFKYYVLDDFRSTDTVAAPFLAALDADMDLVRGAGRKIIPRFTYTNTHQNGDTGPYDDAPAVARVVAHIEQLGAVLSDHPDVVEAVQTGMVGVWGEWYYTDLYGNLGTIDATNWADRAAIINAWLDELDPDIFVLVRYPGVKHRWSASSALDGTTGGHGGRDQDRVGFHNDGFLAAFDDFGTYTTFTTLNATATRAYLAAQTAAGLPMMGESAATNGTDSQFPRAGEELETFHWSSLNPIYHPDVLASWTAAQIAEVKRRLGYRLRLVSADVSTLTSPGGEFTVQLSLANDGYAIPYRAYPVKLVMVGPTTVTRTLQFDVQSVTPGDTVSVTETVLAPTPVGRYKLHLFLPDPSGVLDADPDYAIQLANPGVWDPGTGRNQLRQSLVVSGGSDSAVKLLHEIDGPMGTVPRRRR